MEDINLNLNAANCIRSATDVFETTHHNICKGTEQVVAHGTLDIIVSLFVVSIFVGVATVLFMLALAVIKD